MSISLESSSKLQQANKFKAVPHVRNLGWGAAFCFEFYLPGVIRLKIV